MASFDELKLSAPVLESVHAAGFVKPTPIQSQFVPLALTGRDVMGQAKTGTGKTASFLLPIFERVRPGHSHSQALILAPTRELALQIHAEIGHLGAKLKFTSVTLYGGAPYEPQIEALARGVDIIVGTPGRIMDHMRSGRLDLSGVKVAVLDEADRMLDLGFRKDIEYILRHCPPERQTLLLSATIPGEIRSLGRRFMNDPLEVWTAPESLTVDSVEQFFMVCERETKLPTLLKLLEIEEPSLAIIFCGTKMGAKRLAERLKRLYISAREIHGDLQQKKREKIMGSFRSGKLRLLIATDVASRGIDVQDITHIINYDIPYKIEDYVHRIGRTGRMNKVGKAYTFVTREEAQYLTEIEQLINKEINPFRYEDLTSRWWPTPPSAPSADYVPEPAEAPADVEAPGKKRRRRGKRTSAGADRPAPARENPAGETPYLAMEGATGVLQEAPQVNEDAAGEPVSLPAASGAPEKRGRRRKRKPAQPVPVTCSACGVEALVRFTPKPGRPVYCDACYKRLKPAKAPAESENSETASPRIGTGAETSD